MCYLIVDGFLGIGCIYEKLTILVEEKNTSFPVEYQDDRASKAEKEGKEALLYFVFSTS